jgi:hypothetical protein
LRWKRPSRWLSTWNEPVEAELERTAANANPCHAVMAFVSDDKLAARDVPELEEARTAEEGTG